MITVFCILLQIICGLADVAINIDVNATNTTHFYHFWKSTGFCPPDPKENIPNYLLSDTQKLNIALIGALPNKGITHVRIHWLLNLLTQNENGKISYNFTDMDIFLSRLHKHGLKPGFEFMGYSNDVIKFEKSANFWDAMIASVVKRYIKKFGSKEVAKWRFETWNEPDLKSYNVLNFTLPEYLDYVAGSYSGLKKAFSGTNSSWKLGGPAGLFRDKAHPLCWGLLESCNDLGGSENYSCPLQFLSFHRKGGGSAWGVLNGSLGVLDVIHDRFPGLRKLAAANDEADIQENWSRSLEWRADGRYATMVVRVISGFYRSVAIERKLKIEVLSNDNAFLNYHPFYFTQRTLFARFQINNTAPPHSQFIRKPVYAAMSLLSLLGDELLQEEASLSDPLLTVLATRRKRDSLSFVSVVVAYGNETRNDAGTVKVINVLFKNVGDGWRFVIYRLDNVETNPFEVWRAFGNPVFPGRYQRRKMRESEEPKRLFQPATIKGPTFNVTLKLGVPSVHLISMCSAPDVSPKVIHDVTIYNVTWNEVLITWRYSGKHTNCLRTFEVENQSKCSRRRKFQRINPVDTIFMSFHHVGKAGRDVCERTRGDYRVRAVDYWDFAGEYSEIISYPSVP